MDVDQDWIVRAMKGITITAMILAAWNVCVFAMYGLDKEYAKRRGWRFLWALLVF